MASLREEILQDCLGWVDYVTAAPTDKIIKAFDHDSAVPRPQKPYITCQIPNFDNLIGWDELDRRNNSGTAQVRIKGSRWALLQVDGYGKNATEWVGTLHRTLKRPDVRRWLENNGPIGINQQGPIEDGTALLAGDQERRVIGSFRVTYAFETEWVDSGTGIAQKLELQGSKFIDPTNVSDLDINMVVP